MTKRPSSVPSLPRQVSACGATVLRSSALRAANCGPTRRPLGPSSHVHLSCAIGCGMGTVSCLRMGSDRPHFVPPSVVAAPLRNRDALRNGPGTKVGNGWAIIRPDGASSYSDGLRRRLRDGGTPARAGRRQVPVCDRHSPHHPSSGTTMAFPVDAGHRATSGLLDWAAHCYGSLRRRGAEPLDGPLRGERRIRAHVPGGLGLGAQEPLRSNPCPANASDNLWAA